MVTVNVSREGRSRERYSYVVSSVPRGVSPAVLPQTLPAPCEGAAARAPAGFDKPSAAKTARALEEQLAFVPHLSGSGKPSARGRAAAGRSLTHLAASPSSCRGLSLVLAGSLFLLL